MDTTSRGRSHALAGGRGPPSHVPALLPGLACLAVLVVVLLMSTGTRGAMEFENAPVALTKVTVGYQVGVDLAVGPEDRLYAVWEDGRLSAWQAGSVVFFATSEPDSRGRSFTDAVRVPGPSDSVDQLSPRLAVGPDGVVHVVWLEHPRPDTGTAQGFYVVRYSRSLDGGLNWSEPARVSPPNNVNNTGAVVAALPGGVAYVAWEMERYPGTSIALARMENGSRSWYREDLARASDLWEHNLGVELLADGGDNLHAAWRAIDLNGMGDPNSTQVFYLPIGTPGRDDPLASPIPVGDDPSFGAVLDVSLTVTKRHGAWVVWVSTPSDGTVDGPVSVLADQVLDGDPGEDLQVLTGGAAGNGTPRVDTALDPDDGVMVAISGLGAPPTPPLFTSTCSEQGCFAQAVQVIPSEGPAGLNASVTVDALGNVYVGWDDGFDIWAVPRRNSPPGPPELLRPDMFTHDAKPEFSWTFSDPDAGAGQSAFELHISKDGSFSTVWGGGVVTGALGRYGRYTPPSTLAEGRWFWRVSTRDQLGLWSPWSGTGSFIADRTPPVASLSIDDGATFTHELVVELTLNATDNLQHLGVDMFFSVSSDPNFPNASLEEYPPPNHKVNFRLPPGDGVKVVFLRVIDGSGLSYTAMDTIEYNQTALVIVHTPIATAPEGKAMNVTCEILRPTGVKATLLYRRAGEKAYKERDMVVNGTSFHALIPKDEVTTKGVEYYIRARVGTVTVTSPPSSAADEPYEVNVYETTEEYQPPIYAPTLTIAGAVIIAALLFAVWYYRLRT